MPDSVAAPTSADEADAVFDRTISEIRSTRESGATASGPPASPSTQPVQQATPQSDAQAPAPPSDPESPTEPTATEDDLPSVEEPDTPISFRAGNQDYTVPGSAVGPDGIFISATDGHSQNAIRLMQLGRHHETTYRQDMATADHSLKREVAAREGAESALDEILSRIDEHLRKGTLHDWATEQESKFPETVANARVKAASKRTEELERQLNEGTSERDRATLEPQMDDALETTITHFGQQHKLTREQMLSVFDLLSDPGMKRSLFQQAKEDDPSNQVKRGEWLIDYGIVERHVKHMASLTPKQAQKQKADAAAAQNAKSTQPAKVPPAVGAKKGPAPSPEPAKPQFKNAEEADDYIWGKRGWKSLA